MATTYSKTRADAILNSLPATTYLALLTALPTTNTGTGLVEAAGGGYARQAISQATWAAITTAADNLTEQTSTNGAIAFPTNTGGTLVVAGVALYDALTAGNLLEAVQLAGGSVSVPNGSFFNLPIGNLKRTMAGV
jgi:hypothetical protein